MGTTRVKSQQLGDAEVKTADIADGAVTEAKQTLADNTTCNVSSSAHGYAPKNDNNAAHYLSGQGTYTSPTGVVLPGYINGFTLANNGSDANNDIDFGAGLCADSTGVAYLTGSAKTKQLDATWAAGTNAGGLDTGSKANSTWYHCYAILKDSDQSVDYLFSTSASSPTMPTGYTYKRRLGTVRTNSSGNLIAFTQYGDEFLWATRDYQSNTVGSTAFLYGLLVPTGVKVIGKFSMWASSAGSNYMTISAIDQTDNAPLFNGTGGLDLQEGASDAKNAPLVLMRTDTSGQVRTRATGNMTVACWTIGWIDQRGKT